MNWPTKLEGIRSLATASSAMFLMSRAGSVASAYISRISRVMAAVASGGRRAFVIGVFGSS